ncbi:MAG: helix-turn-helix domain-containing protein [Gemmatimonadales bacterium]
MARARRKRNRPYPITRRDQLAALASAVRQEIIDTIQAAGPCSAAEIAALMGRPADALYYHIRKLVAVGLLLPVEPRRPNGREEAVYDLVGHPLVLEYPPRRKSEGHPHRALVRSMVSTAERDVAAALVSPTTRQDTALRNLWVGRRHAWLTRRDLKRVNELIDELVEVMTTARDPERGELCTLTLLLAPRRPRDARRGRASTTTRE